MHFPLARFVAYSLEPAKVRVSWQSNRLFDVQIIRAERDALFGEKAGDDASIRMLPVMNVSFEYPIHSFERHHVVQVCRPEIDDIIHDMDQHMDHNVKECGREVHLKLA